MLDHGDYEASCAVCGEPAEGECSSNCESARLHMAIDRAEAQWLDKWREKTREWVANNAVRYVTSTFGAMKESRLDHHRAYIRALPYFSVYEQYGGRPPLHPHYVANLHRQIRDADVELRRNIDADWKSCVVRYPEVLAFYYSQVNIVMPKLPEMPSTLTQAAASMPRFNTPKPMSSGSRSNSNGSSILNGAAAMMQGGNGNGGQKKPRRNSKTLSMSGKSMVHEEPDDQMAMLSKMFKESNSKEHREPYSRPATSSRIVDRYLVPEAPQPPPSRNASSRQSKRLSLNKDYSAMGAGILRAPTAPAFNQPYRPDGGRFG